MTAIFDPAKPKHGKQQTKSSAQLESRPTDILRAPSKPKKKVADNWGVIEDMAEWPYPDPDMALAVPEPSIDDVLPTDQELPSDIVPYSEYEPWGRRSDETDTEYKYFLAYRAQGFGRQLQGVCTRFNVSRIHIGEIAKRNEWHARAVAWDIERERVYTQEMLNGTREMARKHVRIAERGLKVLASVFDEVDTRLEDPDFVTQLKKIPPKALITLAQRSAAVVPNLMAAERLARNLPTDIHEVRSTQDEPHTIEELAELVFALAAVLPEQPGIIEGTVIEDDAGRTVEIPASDDTET